MHYSTKIHRAIARAIVEILEARELLSATITDPIADQSFTVGAADSVINLTSHYGAPTTVRLATTQGNIDLELTDEATPLTVANFLAYVDASRYNDTIIHRLASSTDPNDSTKKIPFVLQMGGYATNSAQPYVQAQVAGTAVPTLQHIAEFAPVQNEFQAGVTTNTLWTVAMAKKGGNPNSATSEFFVNLNNNAGNLDSQNGGFTTFGAVTINSRPVVTAIGNLNIGNANSPLDELPLTRPVGTIVSSGTVQRSDFVIINSAGVVQSTLGLAANTDNPQLVTATIEGTSLRLHVLPGQTGNATVNVVITSGTGEQVTDTFHITVSPSTAETVNAVVGTGGSKKVVWTEADGTIATMTLSQGSGTLNFTGQQLLSQSTKSGITEITGTNVLLNTLSLTDADKGTLSITTRGADRSVAIGSISSATGLGKLSAPLATLTGTGTFGGDVASLQLASADQLTISGNARSIILNQSAQGITVTGNLASGKFGSIGGLDVLSANAISFDALTGNLNSTGAIATLKGNTIAGNISVGSGKNWSIGTITGDVTVTGDLTTAKFTTITGETSIGGASRSLTVLDTASGAMSIGQSTSLIKITTLAGALSVIGAARSVSIGNDTGHPLSFGGADVAGAAVTLTITRASDVAVTSTIPLRSIKTDAWTNDTGANETIVAPSIGSIVSKGAFDPSLSIGNPNNAPKALPSASIKGPLGAADWSIAGNVGSLAVGSVPAGWTGSITGSLASLKIAGDFAGNLAAGSARSIVVGGNMTQGAVSLTDARATRTSALGTLAVKGGILGSTIAALHGDIGSISAAAMTDSKVAAGTDPNSFDNALADFTDDARIARVTIRPGAGAVPTFSNSVIQARFLGAINVGTIDLATGPAFGLTGDQIASVAGVFNGTKLAKLVNLTDPSQSTTNASFEIRVV